eukprot:180709_1
MDLNNEHFACSIQWSFYIFTSLIDNLVKKNYYHGSNNGNHQINFNYNHIAKWKLLERVLVLIMVYQKLNQCVTYVLYMGYICKNIYLNSNKNSGTMVAYHQVTRDICIIVLDTIAKRDNIEPYKGNCGKSNGEAMAFVWNIQSCN